MSRRDAAPAPRPLARIKTILLLAAGMLAAGAVMYLVAHHELQRVAHGAHVAAATRTIMLTIFTIMAGFSALCGLGFYSVIFRPLSGLNKVISRRAAGDRHARLAWSRSDEIGTIGRNFDAMVDAINDAEEQLRAFAANTVRALALAVDAKDPYTRNHSERVGRYAASIARALRFDQDRIARIHTAGVLHDVGKIAVPDAVLLSPNRLTDSEYETMKEHSAVGERLVAGAGMPELARWIRHHHERFDGGGYPDRIAADAIPHEARILAVADSFEAMTSDRYYRSALGTSEALAELERHAGAQFDPEIVAVFTALVRSGREGPTQAAGELPSWDPTHVVATR